MCLTSGAALEFSLRRPPPAAARITMGPEVVQAGGIRKPSSYPLVRVIMPQVQHAWLPVRPLSDGGPNPNKKCQLAALEQTRTARLPPGARCSGNWHCLLWH